MFVGPACRLPLLTGLAGTLPRPRRRRQTQRSHGQSDSQRLEGRWVRPDGGYVLELRNIRKDGSLSAAYFNPMPIKVYRAEVKKRNGKTVLFVELRDVNYPGSTYNLRLRSDKADRLKGTYFQAVEKKDLQRGVYEGQIAIVWILQFHQDICEEF